MLYLVLRNFRKRKVKFLANVLVIATGIIMIYSTIILNLAVSTGLDINENRLGADYMIVPEGTQKLMGDEKILLTSAPICVYMNENVVDEIRKINGVSEVNTQFFAQTLNASCCSVATASRIIGINLSENSIIKAWLQEQVTGNLEKNEIIVGNNIRGENGFVEILGRRYLIKGKLDETGGAMDNAILMNMDETKNIVKSNPQFDHFWERYGEPEGLVSSIQIKVEKNKNTEVYEKLKEISGIDIIAEEEVYREVSAQLDMITGILFGICILTTVISVIQLFAEFTNQAYSRKSEWGLFRALGLNKTQLKSIILGEAFLQVVLGCTVGAVGSIAWLKFLLNLINKRQTIPFVMPSIGVCVVIWGIIFIFYMICAFVVSFYPMWTSGKLDLMTIMMKGDID